ncbi:hypothetical protein LPJ58_005277 [Coemansia sp. RSA 1591]|nr:hypothetical protein LPJ58_005277 [Coemansia sp. RSA 1591]KAJ1754953.1 hypothetical protein LPJ69_005250 [Coemansia sp. RSA 1752]KAJ1764762.1 hypothetical protein LPJ54_005453 [Coemansia sp. RSA 1824]KAJ1782229.1 hypothetical protein LPJ67_005174 [Coemansia sp. RSA 1938]KAJ2201610.1 hypothetical protein IW144_000221 [Coemansia sp. RSA 522]KAJ2294073.1 hypothetical protein IW141_000687 [Coemansia sp. RSA 355]KAJ2418112.1 hypothetical protein GGF47_005122 [Coemansia sp. RSA 2524]KAJ2729784.
MTNEFKGGLIVGVENSDQAKIAEGVGARGVVVVVANVNMNVTDIAFPATAVTADTAVVRDVLGSVLVPVIGRIRLGHIIEAKVMEACHVDAIDEHEGLTQAADEGIEKFSSNIPIIAGVQNLKESLKAILQGASMLRTHFKLKEDRPLIGETVKVLTKIADDIEGLNGKTDAELTTYLGSIKYPLAGLKNIIKTKKFPVPLFAEGGIILPTDVAMVMGLNADGCIASSLVFKVPDPKRRIHSMIKAVQYYNNPAKLINYLEDS